MMGQCNRLKILGVNFGLESYTVNFKVHNRHGCSGGSRWVLEHTTKFTRTPHLCAYFEFHCLCLERNCMSNAYLYISLGVLIRNKGFCTPLANGWHSGACPQKELQNTKDLRQYFRWCCYSKLLTALREM